jgi:hypothetical protein
MMKSSQRVSRILSRLAWISLVLLAVARSAIAQFVHGTVTDSVARQRVEGAVLMLLDASGTALGRTISNERGEYRLVIRHGARAMRVLRIGFRARVIPLSLDTASDTQIDIRLSRLPTLLESVHVEANPMCPRQSDADATYALLGQARAGLLSVVVAREASPAALERLLFERTMDGTSDAIERQVVRIDTAPPTPTSFSAVYAATDFLTRGLSRTPVPPPRRASSPRMPTCCSTKASPAATASTSRAARATIQASSGSPLHPPTAGPIEWTSMVLWIDTLARSLRDGEVARATWSDGQHWRASLGTLRLHATRRGGAPAAGAAIHFPSTDYKGIADSAGNIEIDDILPGPYTVAVDEPRVAALRRSGPASSPRSHLSIASAFRAASRSGNGAG